APSPQRLLVSAASRQLSISATIWLLVRNRSNSPPLPCLIRSLLSRFAIHYANAQAGSSSPLRRQWVRKATKPPVHRRRLEIYLNSLDRPPQWYMWPAAKQRLSS